MVGHTGNYDATIIAMEAVDENIGRIMKTVDNYDDTILIIVADHGNCEEMYQDENKKSKTSHTLNKVPFIIYGNNIDNIKIKTGEYGLANLASTITTILGIKPNENWLESIVDVDNTL